MAYFQELPETIQAQLWEELRKKFSCSDETTVETIDEVIDDWINRHNWDLSNVEWQELVESAERED